MNVIGKIDWSGFLKAVEFLEGDIKKLNEGYESSGGGNVEGKDCSPIILGNVPEVKPEDVTKLDMAVLSTIHRLLMDIHVTEGTLECPDTGRKFNISEGIPNMLLLEDEL